jgi:hypothetical protein
LQLKIPLPYFLRCRRATANPNIQANALREDTLLPSNRNEAAIHWPRSRHRTPRRRSRCRAARCRRHAVCRQPAKRFCVGRRCPESPRWTRGWTGRRSGTAWNRAGLAGVRTPFPPDWGNSVARGYGGFLLPAGGCLWPHIVANTPQLGARSGSPHVPDRRRNHSPLPLPQRDFIFARTAQVNLEPGDAHYPQFLAPSRLAGRVSAQDTIPTTASPNIINTSPPPPRPPNRIAAIPKSASPFANVVIPVILRGPKLVPSRLSGNDPQFRNKLPMYNCAKPSGPPSFCLPGQMPYGETQRQGPQTIRHPRMSSGMNLPSSPHGNSGRHQHKNPTHMIHRISLSGSHPPTAPLRASGG